MPTEDTTVAVRLVAINQQFRRAMSEATADVKKFTGAAQTQMKDFSAAAQKGGRDMTTLSVGALAVGGAIAVGFGLAANAAMGFDKQMSEVGAVAGATGAELGQLRQAALDAGAATVFSASEAAQAEAELAKAGVSTSDILAGGLTGALNLASAGSLNLATAAEYAAAAMTTFGLSGSDVPRIADTLAAAANKSAADVGDMGMALQQAGLVADQAGLTLEETSGVLSLFAQAGLKGSDAGTSLKTALLKLNPSSVEAKNLMDDLGLSFYDANGEFVGISIAAQKLKDKLGPLSDEQRTMALSTIFGTDAIRGATILMESGSAGVNQWTDAVSESGYAADLAAQKTDNLAGDMDQLKGSIETAMISGGSQATDVLRGLTQALTGVVNGLGEMPAPLQTAFLGATGLIGLGSAAIGVYGTLAPKVQSFKNALVGLGGIGPSVAANLGTIGLAAGGVSAALAVVAWSYGEAAKDQAEFNAKVDKFIEAMKDGGTASAEFEKSIRSAFTENNVGKILADSDADLKIFTRGVRESGTELDRLARFFEEASVAGDLESSLKAMAEGGNELADELMRLREEGQISAAELQDLVVGLDDLNDAVDTGAQKMAVENEIVGSLSDVTSGAADETSKFADEQLAAAQALEETTEALQKQYDATLKLAGSDVAYRQAQIDSRVAIEEYNAAMANATLSANDRESAGLDLIGAFLAESEAAVGLASDMAESTGQTLSAADAAAIQRGALENLRDTLAPGNPLRQQLQGYIDQLLAVEEEIRTTAILDTSQATLALSDLQYQIDAADGRTINVTAQVNARTSVKNDDGTWNLDNNPATGGGRAAGGPVMAGRKYRVNELGTEAFQSMSGEMGLLKGPFFTPQDSGWIYTAAETARMMQGGPSVVMAGGRGDINVNLTVHATGGADPGQIRATVMSCIPEIKREMRTTDRAVGVRG